ncbi:MAG: DUF554 domain-containing protein [Erysipelotrichaceae bacterium]
MGIIVNVIAIVIGVGIGLVLKRIIKKCDGTIFNDVLALVVLGLGIINVIKSNNYILIIISFLVGYVICELFGVDEKINSVFGKFNDNSKSNFDGFVVATLLFLVGAMSIVGSIECGLNQNQTLYTKSVLDLFSAIFITFNYGYSVIFSIIPVAIFQSIFALGSHILSFVFTSALVNEINALGGLIFIAISLNMLNIKKFKIMNMILSLFLLVGFYYIFLLF